MRHRVSVQIKVHVIEVFILDAAMELDSRSPHGRECSSKGGPEMKVLCSQSEVEAWIWGGHGALGLSKVFTQYICELLKLAH
jgi:hypothetical protein